MSIEAETTPRVKRRKIESSAHTRLDCAGREVEDAPAATASSRRSEIKEQTSSPLVPQTARKSSRKVSATDTEILSAKEHGKQITPTRRGPGRPRKLTLMLEPTFDQSNTEHVVNETSVNPITEKRPGRPRKLETVDSEAPEIPVAADVKSSRRRSSRVQYGSDKKQQDSPTADRVSAIVTQEVVDNRKRHANGKPMGRPRKSDVKLEIETPVSSSIKVKVEPRASPHETVKDTSEEKLSDTRKRSLTGKPLGRPRKSDPKSPVLTRSPKIVSASDAASSCDSVAKKVRNHTEQVAKDKAPYTGPKKFKLRFRTDPPVPVITHPFHIPPKPVHSSFAEYLSTFVSLDEDLTLDAAKERRMQHCQLKERVEKARQSGRLDLVTEKPKVTSLRSSEPLVAQSHLDHLNLQAAYFSKLMHDERRRNYSNARKIAAMIQAHFKRLESADERQHAETLKSLRQLAKRTANEIRRKWRLAEKEVRRRLTIKIQEEQRALGKEQLNQILQHSTDLLDAQMSARFDSGAFDDTVSEDNEDHYLSVEELRAKYANIPDLIPNSGSEVGQWQGPGDEDDDSSASSDLSKADVEGHVKDVTLESLDDDVSSDDSPMDSELDSTENESTSDTEDGDLPGLSFLYPELNAHKPDLELIRSEPLAEEASKFDEEMPLVPSTDTVKKSVSTSNVRIQSSRTKNDRELLALPSEGELSESDGSDSPMDSELEDSQGSSHESDLDEGPGLSWLYATPLVKPPASDQIGDVVKVSHAEIEVKDDSTSADKNADEELTENKVKTAIPFLLRGVLREYQHSGLDWMAGLYLNGTNGILADEVCTATPSKAELTLLDGSW